jgi:putative membrane protein
MADNSENSKNIRDHLANERTFLAWIRTSIAIMAFGFVVVKFSLFLKQLSILIGKQFVYKGVSPVLGVILVSAGAVILFLAFLRFRKVQQQIDINSFTKSSTLIPTLAFAIIAISLILVVFLIRNIMAS